MASDDPFEELILFQPQIAKRLERDRNRVPSLLIELGRRRRTLPGQAAGRRTSRRRKGLASVSEPTPLSRRCIVKAHYVDPRDGGGLRLHLAYLERDGVETDGSPGQLYGADESFDRNLFEGPIAGEPRQFRFIISPEDAGELDLRTFCRELMAHMSGDLGMDLLWTAVNHHNTEHPHVHVVIRGIARDGHQVFIPESYIKEHLRARAQEIATRELGPRTERHFRRQRSAEISQERLTSLDRRIQTIAGQGGRLSARALAAARPEERPALLARLRTLKDMGLAESQPLGGWTLAPDWVDRLRSLGERGDIIKRVHRIAGGDVSRYQIADPGGLTRPVEGVVRGKGLHDELRGVLFAAIETTAGSTHYIPLPPGAEDLKQGAVVRVIPTEESWVKASDKIIAEQAIRNKGIYDPRRHLAVLEASPSRRGTPAAELVAGNIRRLKRLEHYGLVRQTGDQWRVPGDLIAQLGKRQRSHPRRRVRVELCGAALEAQITHPGPTWLDRQHDAETLAHTGFGAAVRRARRERAAYLHALGLDQNAGSFTAEQLEDRERSLVARQVARELGAGAAPADPSRPLRGVLRKTATLPSGRQYLWIADDARRFLLMPAAVNAGRLEGQLVEVALDPKGVLGVRPAPRLTRGDEP